MKLNFGLKSVNDDNFFQNLDVQTYNSFQGQWPLYLTVAPKFLIFRIKLVYIVI